MTMELPYSDELEIQYLSRLFDNTSECYKFFWFQAIVTKVLEGKTVLYLHDCQDVEINRQKRTLTKNVPYRLQAPFMNQLKGKSWNVSEPELAMRINQEKRLIYYFDELNGMRTSCIRRRKENWRR
ncbi:MAG: hypothetical protein LIO86_09315 [Lachnospiraceae bacterium]|nr:hypothetical protein [Lachnospiraceae bacterium]